MTEGEKLNDLKQLEARRKMSKEDLLVEFDKLSQWSPNWRDESQYQDYRFANKERTKKYKGLLQCEDLQFASEFLRRNEDYQEDFLKLWLNEPEDRISWPDQSISAKYGLTYSPLYAPWVKRPGLCFDCNDRKINKKYAESDQVLYFDVGGNIAEQLKQAEEYLQFLKKRLKTGTQEKEHKKIRRDKYKNYLRIIDAVNSGATNTEIGRVLFLNQSSGAENMLSLVKDRKKQAEIMRSYGYLHLGRNGTEKFRITKILVHM